MAGRISLHAACSRQVTVVSNTFIDRLLPDADGEYVKIYLCLLRELSNPSGSFSMEALADRLGHTERDIRKALSYWQERKLLRLEFDGAQNLVGVCLLDPDEESVPLTVNLQTETSGNRENSPIDHPDMGHQQADSRTEESHPEKNASRRPAYSPEQLPSFSPEERDRMAGDSDSRELLYVTEQFLGHPLSLSETDLVLFWHWTLGFSVNMIEFLVEQCVNAGHSSIHYMNKVAIGWKNDGISTEEEARLSSGIHSSAYQTIRKTFGISGRELSPREENYLKKWTGEYAFTDEMIAEACERALAHTGKVSFGYADSILSSWNENHIRSLSEVRNADQVHAASRIASGRSSGGKVSSGRPVKSDAFDELEKKLLS